MEPEKPGEKDKVSSEEVQQEPTVKENEAAQVPPVAAAAPKEILLLKAAGLWTIGQFKTTERLWIQCRNHVVQNS